MFLKNSRYYTTPTVVAYDANNREVKALSLRRLVTTSGERTQVQKRFGCISQFLNALYVYLAAICMYLISIKITPCNYITHDSACCSRWTL